MALLIPMRPITTSSAVAAIVVRSGEVEVPYAGKLALVCDENEETLVGRWRPTHEDGRPMAPGDVLNSEEAERAVRFLLGLGPVLAGQRWPRRAKIRTPPGKARHARA
jgi:hypothetical protein